MHLYLVRHGHAVGKQDDPRCPLSDRGRADVQRVASHLARIKLGVPRVLHSGKLRAEETAALLSAAVGAGGPPQKTGGLDPLDDPAGLARSIGSWTQDTMVVGHLPFVARLTSHLLVGDDTAVAVAFGPGTVVCLERSPEADWSVAWMICPELLGAGDQERA